MFPFNPNSALDVSDEEHGLDYVVAALTVMEDLRRERSIPDGVFALDIDSGLDDGAGRKFGLGSSAAVTVGVVGVDPLARVVARRVGQGVGSLSADAFERDNYYLVSIYRYDMNGRSPGGEWEFLGIAAWFIPLDTPEF